MRCRQRDPLIWRTAASGRRSPDVHPTRGHAEWRLARASTSTLRKLVTVSEVCCRTPDASASNPGVAVWYSSGNEQAPPTVQWWELGRGETGKVCPHLQGSVKYTVSVPSRQIPGSRLKSPAEMQILGLFPASILTVRACSCRNLLKNLPTEAGTTVRNELRTGMSPRLVGNLEGMGPLLREQAFLQSFLTNAKLETQILLSSSRDSCSGLTNR